MIIVPYKYSYLLAYFSLHIAAYVSRKSKLIKYDVNGAFKSRWRRERPVDNDKIRIGLRHGLLQPRDLTPIPGVHLNELRCINTRPV